MLWPPPPAMHPHEVQRLAERMNQELQQRLPIELAAGSGRARLEYCGFSSYGPAFRFSIFGQHGSAYSNNVGRPELELLAELLDRFLERPEPPIRVEVVTRPAAVEIVERPRRKRRPVEEPPPATSTIERLQAEEKDHIKRRMIEGVK